MDQHSPIGVFDSGLGGLTIVREIQSRLPKENIIYFGDLARLPYGIKSKRQICICSRENTDFLLQFQIKALVIACNSSSSAAYDELTSRYSIPILDVIRPAARTAVSESRKKRIGVLGTQATVASRAYEKEIKRTDSNAQVVAVASPLLVPLVEEGLLNAPVTNHVLNIYLEPLRRARVDTVILGCTHFPLLRRAIQKQMGAKVRLVDCAPPAVTNLIGLLEHKNLLKNGTAKGRLHIYVSDMSQNFLEIGERFLGQRLRHVQQAHLKEEVTVQNRWTL